MSTVAERLVAALRAKAQEFTPGDQRPPCVVLWPDPEHLWEGVVPDLQAGMAELFRFGPYAPEERAGPAIWLRCIEARVLGDLPPEATPVFYLPGVSREQLRAVEDCPAELSALVELQYRGVVWFHQNGKDWTPNAFLVTKQGGLGLDVAKDQATLEALAGALPVLLAEPVAQYEGKRLDADVFNGLVAPDSIGSLLRWMNDAESFKKRRSDSEWKAFQQQCKTEFKFDALKDGLPKAARMLAERGGAWHMVWKRFAEAPANFPGVVEWLRKSTPKDGGLFATSEVWPDINEREERLLRRELEALANKPQDEAIRGVLELDAKHGKRREYPWFKLGLSPFAAALVPLAELAEHCKTSHGAPTAEQYAEFYAVAGWRVDAAATAAMAACTSIEHSAAVLGALRAIYLPWLDTTARHLQKLVLAEGQSLKKRSEPFNPSAGRVVVFADGLRMDVGHRLTAALTAAGVECKVEWDWSTIPSVTATAKPAVSPIAGAIKGGDPGQEFGVRLASTGQALTQDRFVAALKGAGWQVLGPTDLGDPPGSAWTEAGTLDKRGHTDGWKMARAIESEVSDLASRIQALVRAGWTEVVVVTDHGWLLVPLELPKIELKAYLTESRWGRCAELKDMAQAETIPFKWTWNSDVAIACPPGAGCYYKGMEYSHGGISLQESVTPILRVGGFAGAGSAVRILEAKWTGAKCRVWVKGASSGVQVDIRTRISDPSTSLLANGQAQGMTAEGKVSVFLEDDADLGRAAELVLLDADGQVLQSLSVTLGQ
jgi:hypothetical protein